MWKINTLIWVSSLFGGILGFGVRLLADQSGQRQRAVAWASQLTFPSRCSALLDPLQYFMAPYARLLPHRYTQSNLCVCVCADCDVVFMKRTSLHTSMVPKTTCRPSKKLSPMRMTVAPPVVQPSLGLMALMQGVAASGTTRHDNNVSRQSHAVRNQNTLRNSSQPGVSSALASVSS